MLLRPGFLTVRRPPSFADVPADALLAETGDALLAESGLYLVKE